ncbi:MAG: deoxyribodipyrimidine photolyase [Candidatus Cloacimonas sp. SDB]|nr:MAG: deoxyribodipyrimidine photolyase [Candidatus Cloacimonas sp. SDB]
MTEQTKKNISVFWFRRDLRLEDNKGLEQALNSEHAVLPIFIFDDNIIAELPEDDARITFIYDSLQILNFQLREFEGSLLILKGKPEEIWQKLISEYQIKQVFFNQDYEPYAIERDNKIRSLLQENGIQLKSYKDQVIFAENEVVKQDGKPYTVFTSYKKKWLENYYWNPIIPSKNKIKKNFLKLKLKFPELSELGYKRSVIKVRDYDLSHLDRYAETRDFPGLDHTTYLGPHLRFGRVSIRKIIADLKLEDEIFLSELIWREFFLQILFHFPRVVTENFKTRYNGIRWNYCLRNFERWCNGETGYPFVDAGMRQLNETGFMHNRVRMIAAGFLCKHLLIDWRWGESYFYEKLLDYELSSNNGNWQWAAGTGCDAAPYFRIFNPAIQLKKFDRDLKYVKKWIPEYGTSRYSKPIVEHKSARLRALEVYKAGITE